jgi:hypothetical protein
VRRARIGGVHRFHAGLAQREGDHVADGAFVFDDEDVFLHAITARRAPKGACGAVIATAFCYG